RAVARVVVRILVGRRRAVGLLLLERLGLLRARIEIFDPAFDLGALLRRQRLLLIVVLERQAALVEENGLAAVLRGTIRLRHVVQIRSLLALVWLELEALLERVDGGEEVAQVVLGLAFLVVVVRGLRLRQRQRRNEQREQR